jgi:hypothetical protein
MQSNVAIAMAGAGLLPAAPPRKKATIIGALAASGTVTAHLTRKNEDVEYFVLHCTVK